MYAVLDILGKQFKVKEDEHVYVPKLKYEVGSYVDMTKVLLFNNGSETKMSPEDLGKVKVKCKVIDHVKSDKIIVFKKKRRKGYKKKQGHRQEYTKVLVEKICDN